MNTCSSVNLIFKGLWIIYLKLIFSHLCNILLHPYLLVPINWSLLFVVLWIVLFRSTISVSDTFQILFSQQREVRTFYSSTMFQYKVKSRFCISSPIYYGCLKLYLYLCVCVCVWLYFTRSNVDLKYSKFVTKIRYENQCNRITRTIFVTCILTF
jgi:hypothetical protein